MRGSVSDGEALADPRLTIELVPSTAWYDNVRNRVTPAQWKRCQRYVRERSGNRCEICGGTGDRYPVDCHERWVYEITEDSRSIQRLDDLIALCPRCHEVKHAGRAQVMGRTWAVIEQLRIVNGWSDAQANGYLDGAMRLWAIRSQLEWELDIGVLTEILGP